MRIYKQTMYTEGVSNYSMAVWANSADKMLFRFMKNPDVPVDLTGKTVGFYLLTGPQRLTASCRRPTSYAEQPITTGVTVICATEGFVEYVITEADFLFADTSLWMEWYAITGTTLSTKSLLGQIQIRVEAN